MSDIFLSYAREDLPRVKPVVYALAARGWSVWWDRTIRPGQSFARVIQAALDEAGCVVVLWSRDSVQSRWVLNEAGEGDRRGILIPALLDDVLTPLAFRDIQAANLVGWTGALPHAGFEELAQGVEGILETSAARSASASVGAAAPEMAAATPRTERVDRAERAVRPAAGVAESWWRFRRQVIAIGLAAAAIAGAAVYASRSRVSLVAGQTRVNPKDGLTYVWIQPGKFMMGCSTGDTDCSKDEKPPTPGADRQRLLAWPNGGNASGVEEGDGRRESEPLQGRSTAGGARVLDAGRKLL
jgi:hypothetical protein